MGAGRGRSDGRREGAGVQAGGGGAVRAGKVGGAPRAGSRMSGSSTSGWKSGWSCFSGEWELCLARAE